jgi:enoyl-CoA hydratase/carnithine racemase
MNQFNLNIGDGVARITLSNPPRNQLGVMLVEELDCAVQEVCNANVRVRLIDAGIRFHEGGLGS